MATSYKKSSVLGTSGLSSYATLYSTTSTTTAVLSTIAICNRSTADKKFRIAICSTQNSPSNADFIAYDTTDNTLSFTAFVAEIS